MSLVEASVAHDGIEDSPIRIFLSYAHEDDEIVTVFQRAFDFLEREVDGNLRVFRDRSSIPPGGYISEQIKDDLRLSDYLVVFFTGITRKNVSWNGVEVGFFQALMDDERKRTGKTTRRIVPIYFDELPPTLTDVKGISLRISSNDLSRPKDEYVEGLATRQEDEDDPLSEFLREVARRAESRSRQRAMNEKDAEKKKKHRDETIDKTIVPLILSAMYDSLGARIAKRSIEQRLIEFQIEGGVLTKGGIPPEARLVEHGKAFSLFKLPNRESEIEWQQFAIELTEAAKEDAPVIMRAMERVFDSAIDNVKAIDNDQLIRAPGDGELYRVLVTTHFDYYNGRKIVHMYFIEKLKRKEYGSEDTTIALAYLNVAARYRSIFLEPKSELSVRAFKNESENSKLQDMVIQTQREIVLIEDEAEQLKLDSFAAKSVLWGAQADPEAAKKAKLQWQQVRSELFASANRVLAANPEEAAFAEAIKNWMTVLEKFTAVAGKINADVGGLALARLTEFFAH
ncbi:toll/interleukin-1 receptor domain-containing protein [Bradyrhizobium sp. Bra78]|uniref:toll/interleukin-1 receptor domain-containing protein n=1 Tax=Bradyrhizobium sp. Bra78 TaxID=2926010 RepID=UPI0021C5C881|nr:toll/interleukin-1 receptor domain-containing protein [Bradyrhizobium sp. Bra78]